jgi:hypothetical protein
MDSGSPPKRFSESQVRDCFVAKFIIEPAEAGPVGFSR